MIHHYREYWTQLFESYAWPAQGDPSFKHRTAIGWMDIRIYALEYLRVTLNLEKSKLFYLETRLITCVGANWYHRENVDRVCSFLDDTELPSSLEQAAQR